MELNFWMSVAEAGVVLGVVLEGTEYIPPIHRRWPFLEKIGYLILIIALVGDWHFQTAINDKQTRELIDADNRIVGLSPRYWLMNAGGERIASALKPFAGQKVVIFECTDVDPREEMSAALDLAIRFREAGWVNAWGQRMTGSEPADRVMFRVTEQGDAGRCSQGLFIEVKSAARPRTRLAAKTLERALGHENIGALDLGRLNWPYPSFLPSADDDIVVVSVGFKGI